MSSQQQKVKEFLSQKHGVPVWEIGFSTDERAATEGGRRLIHQEYIVHLKQEMYFFLIPSEDK